jgi:cytochrome c-type biogenesis protein CcmH
VREALMRVEPAVSAAATDPSAADIAAAASLAPAEREAMVRAMVERLAARLADDGGNLDGWLRLIRAYVVLGEFDKARAAAAAARRALAAWPERLHRVEEAMKGLGLDG